MKNLNKTHQPKQDISSAIKIGFIAIKEAKNKNPLAINFIQHCIMYAEKKSRSKDCAIFDEILKSCEVK